MSTGGCPIGLDLLPENLRSQLHHIGQRRI
jgi:hypothetical protein